ncbi:MAG: endonuclease domain-containing protein [Elusimicrobiota bacterium]
MKVYYNPKLKELARKLRNNSTLSEVLLWQQLKNKQMMNYDFHRQKPIDEYIVDFFCPELNLIIEIDGKTHIDKRVEQDMKRQSRLESLGFHILRFLDFEVKQNMEAVLFKIREWILTHPCIPS